MPNVSTILALIWIGLFTYFLTANVKDFMKKFANGDINSDNIYQTTLFTSTSRVFKLMISFSIVLCVLALSPGFHITSHTKGQDEVTFFSAPQIVDEPDDKALGSTLLDLKEDRRPYPNNPYVVTWDSHRYGHLSFKNEKAK